MYIPKELRRKVYKKCGGRCAYTGTILKDDWQVDHYYPVRYCKMTLPNVQLKVFNELEITDPNDFHNLLPAQRIVNHYKRALLPGKFKSWYLGGLHERLAALPKNPRTEKSINHKRYLLEVAELFGITPNKPFNGIFYFETLDFVRTL